MWLHTNERYLDRSGCGDELFLDADRKASSVLAALHGSDDLGGIDELEYADDTAAR
jgi:hypothetical protein